MLPEDYTGRAELEQSCLTAKAWSLQNAGQYAEAREVWHLLGDMPGAREQAALCVYEPAKALMEAEDWDGAITRTAARRRWNAITAREKNWKRREISTAPAGNICWQAAWATQNTAP